MITHKDVQQCVGRSLLSYIGIEPLIFCCNLFFLYSRNPIPQDGNQYLLMPVKRKDGVKVAIKEVMYLCTVCNESTDET